MPLKTAIELDTLIKLKTVIGYLEVHALEFALLFDDTKHNLDRLRYDFSIPRERVMFLLNTLYNADVTLAEFLNNLSTLPNSETVMKDFTDKLHT